MSAGRDKLDYLDSLGSPKIVFVGGSNLAFSLDSQKVENELGIPVVNMGLHAGLGLRLMLNEATRSLHAGDIVVIVPEYEHFDELSLDGRPGELGPFIKSCPRCLRGVTNVNQLKNIYIGILQKLEGYLEQPLKGDESDLVYCRKCFNKWGDVVAHLEVVAPAEIKDLPEGDAPLQREFLRDDSPIVLLNDFYENQASKGVIVVLMFPGIPEEMYSMGESSYLFLYERLSIGLSIPILGTPKDFVFPSAYFYDTAYHMNRDGREIRTQKIIAFIDEYLQSVYK